MQTLIIHIRSMGGSVQEALLIYDYLTGLDCRIITRCYGYAASAATIIAQAATKGNREISQNALYLIHQCSSQAEGNTGELTQTIDLLEKTDQRIAAIYAQAAAREVRHFVQLMSRNNGKGEWLAPKETIELGLTDRIIAAEAISNDARQWLHRLELPEIPSDLIPTEEKKHTKSARPGKTCWSG